MLPTQQQRCHSLSGRASAFSVTHGVQSPPHLPNTFAPLLQARDSGTITPCCMDKDLRPYMAEPGLPRWCPGLQRGLPATAPTQRPPSRPCAQPAWVWAEGPESDGLPSDMAASARWSPTMEGCTIRTVSCAQKLLQSYEQFDRIFNLCFLWSAECRAPRRQLVLWEKAGLMIIRISTGPSF